MAHAPCPLCGSTAGPGHHCPPAVNQLLGRVLDGRYRIESVIGEGGMGCVYRAIQTSIQRPVAVKTLHPSLATSTRFFERFRREAELASKLRHPNVITVFDFGQTDDGTCYYVMELVEGESLRQMVRRAGPLSLRRAADLVEQAARGLAHAHAMQCIHRDLKPHNLMVQRLDGREFIKVLDFGLVKLLEDEEMELTSTGQVLGTPQYMPPEQASGEEVDARADLYALGAVLYFCLTGSSPYGANSVRKALTAALTQPVPTVASRRRGAPVPKEVEELLRKALARDRKDRHSNAEELIDDLSAALAGLSDAELDAVPESEGAAPVEASASPKRPHRAAPKSAPEPKRSEKDAVKAELRATTPARRRGLQRPGGGPRALWVAAGALLVGSCALVGWRLWSEAHLADLTAYVDLAPSATRPNVPALQPPPVAPEPPRQAPRPPPEEVIVMLESDPNGADVFENGVQIGHTPAALSLTRGKHRLTFRARGRELVQPMDLSHYAAGDHAKVHVEIPAPTKAPKAHKKPAGDDIPVFE